MQEPKAGRRIVSKGAYAAQVGRILGLSAAGVLLFVLCMVGLLSSVIVACLLPYTGLLPHTGFAGFASAFAVVFIIVFGGVCSLMMRDLSNRAAQKVKQIALGVPLTRANTADLPALDSLVRASQEPMQAQEGVLLRAASGEAQAVQEGQLLRASVGE